ncbi:MAG: alpha/beta fold hydrolase [Actinomycetota bacterium]
MVRPSASRMQQIQHGTAVFGVFAALMAVFAVGDEAPPATVAAGVERVVDAETVTTTPVPLERVSVPTTTVPATPLGGTDDAVPSTTITTTTTLRPLDPVTFDALDRIDTILDYTDFTAQGASRWHRTIDGLEEFSLVSTADGAEQPVFWLPPEGDHDKPLLVILHSWSSRYTQHAGIPFADWAQENGWAVMAPEFRGKNDDADAVGSALAVQDVVDAVDFATAQPGVDAERVFVVGYSGGGMMALLVAGQHPDKVTAVSAWGPPHDLEDFYDFARWNGLGYWDDIQRACGGDPREEGLAQYECLTRSPISYLDTIREQEIPVFIGQGIWDPFVMRNAAVDVYNGLADPEDRLDDDAVDLLRRGRIPGEPEDAVIIETHFDDRDPDPRFARQSGSVLMVYFAAKHDMVYGAAAEWFASDPR